MYYYQRGYDSAIMSTTRSQSLQELQRRFKEHTGELTTRINAVQTRMTNGMEEIHTILRYLQQAAIPTPPPHQTTIPSNPPPLNLNPPQQPTHNYSTRISKVEFPCFDGKNVRH